MWIKEDKEDVRNLGRHNAVMSGRMLPMLAKKESAILLDSETGKSRYATDKGNLNRLRV
jgi:hypothetical protein